MLWMDTEQAVIIKGLGGLLGEEKVLGGILSEVICVCKADECQVHTGLDFWEFTHDFFFYFLTTHGFTKKIQHFM